MQISWLRAARKASRSLFLVLPVLVIGACGGSSSPASPTSSAPLVFSVSPIDPAAIQFIVPLGNMGPWAHTLPTDHAYIYHHLGAGGFAPLSVAAPAGGTIEGTFPGIGGEMKVWVKVNATTTYYFDHIVPAPGIGAGSRVEAGSVIGSSGGIAFDFAVRDQASAIGFVNPARYGLDTLYARSPFPYFTEPIRSALYAKVQRSGGDLNGKINYDADGTLSGNWFAEDLPLSQSSSNELGVGTRQLALARDVRFPDRQRVSVGGFGFTGLYGVSPEAPDFAAITPASGAVAYRLLETGEPGGPAGTRQLGLLVVQLLDARRLRVEIRPGDLAASATFGAGAAVYVR